MTANVPALIAQSKSQIQDVLPPGHDVDRVIRLAKLAVHRNPTLLKCDPVSIIEGIMTASQLGLEIGRLAHLVPFKGRCQMIPDYKGLIDLALRHDTIIAINARVVYAGEHFEVMQGSVEGVSHIPNHAGARGDGDIVAAYAVAQIAKAGVLVTKHEVMSIEEVHGIRERSRAKSNGPWVTDFAAMAKKTVVKRLCKTLPQNPALGVAVEMDNRHEVGSSSASVPGDTEQTIAAEMAERAKEAQARLAGSLAGGGEDPTTEE